MYVTHGSRSFHFFPTLAIKNRMFMSKHSKFATFERSNEFVEFTFTVRNFEFKSKQTFFEELFGWRRSRRQDRTTRTILCILFDIEMIELNIQEEIVYQHRTFMLFPWITLFTGFEFIVNLLLDLSTYDHRQRVRTHQDVSVSFMKKTFKKRLFSIEHLYFFTCELHYSLVWFWVYRESVDLSTYVMVATSAIVKVKTYQHDRGLAVFSFKLWAFY